MMVNLVTHVAPSKGCETYSGVGIDDGVASQRIRGFFGASRTGRKPNLTNKKARTYCEGMEAIALIR
jgi:hypothetical protein